MAGWQYRGNGPATDQGYHINLPDKQGVADGNRHTAYLEDFSGTRYFLNVHLVEAGYQMNGSQAQVPRGRVFYPRHVVAPRFMVQGQCPNQQDYGNLCEYIRKTQDYALSWQAAGENQYTVAFIMPSASPGGVERYQHLDYNMSGHIVNIRRANERFVNAPEYQFEFVVAYSHKGIYHSVQADAERTKKQIGQFIDRAKREKGDPFQIDPDTRRGAAVPDKPGT